MIKVTIDYNPVFDMVSETILPVDEFIVNDDEIDKFLLGLVKDIDICRIKNVKFDYDYEDTPESES